MKRIIISLLPMLVFVLAFHSVFDKEITIAKTSDNFRFAASMAQFGMLLRNSEFKSASSYSDVLNLAKKAKGHDEAGYRSEFIRLVESAKWLATRNDGEENREEEVSRKSNPKIIQCYIK